jgi:hypothetical protein
MILDGPARARSVLEAIGGKLWTGDKSPNEVHLHRGVPCVRSWSKYQETDKGISLCAAPLRKDSKGRSDATEHPTKVSCPYCVELMHPQACSQAAVPCSFCTGIIMRPKVGGRGSGREDYRHSTLERKAGDPVGRREAPACHVGSGKRYWTRRIVSCQPLAGSAARGKTSILRLEVVVRAGDCQSSGKSIQKCPWVRVRV